MEIFCEYKAVNRSPRIWECCSVHASYRESRNILASLLEGVPEFPDIPLTMREKRKCSRQ